MSDAVRTLVTGGTGTLGRALLPRLRDAGHDVIAASRSPPPGEEGEWRRLDLTAPAGIPPAVEDVDVVVHAATAPRGDTEAVDVRGTERLAAAAADAGVSNLVYPSIVGIDDVPHPYYEHKLAAERAVARSAVPSTVLRSTQFHEFVHGLFERIARLPVWPLPAGVRLQPVDVGEVADRLVAHATPEASGRLKPVGGPRVRTLRSLAGSYRDLRGTWRPTVPLPIPGRVCSALRAGAATCPRHAVGTVSWEEWLRSGPPGV